jgi:hypothetical protein
MANIIITSTTNTIDIAFNTASREFSIVKGCNNRAHISEVIELFDGGVLITMLAKHSVTGAYKVSFDGQNGPRVDTVGGVAITSDGQLCDLIGALIK